MSFVLPDIPETALLLREDKDPLWYHPLGQRVAAAESPLLACRLHWWNGAGELNLFIYNAAGWFSASYVPRILVLATTLILLPNFNCPFPVPESILLFIWDCLSRESCQHMRSCLPQHSREGCERSTEWTNITRQCTGDVSQICTSESQWNVTHNEKSKKHQKDIEAKQHPLSPGQEPTTPVQIEPK